jgi:hypothetical protein
MYAQKITRTRTAAQDVWVEVWKDDVRLHYYVVRAGERVDLYDEDGFRTFVEPHRLKLDVAKAAAESGSCPEEEREDAIFRVERTGDGDDEQVRKVYGPLYSDPGED